MPRPDQSLRTYSLPAPTGGVDGRNSLFLMPETNAIDIINGICDPDGIRTRGGETEYLDLGSLFTLNTGACGELVATDGTADSFIITTADFIECNSGTSRKAALNFTDNGWYWTQYKYRIFAVNGVDQPIEWSGDGNNAAATSWSGTSLTITDLWKVATGADNCAVGTAAGFAVSTGTNNTLFGTNCALNLTSGDNNVAIGFNINMPSATADNQLNIQNAIYGTGLDGSGDTISAAKIGIGVKAPASKLTVAGDVETTGSSNGIILESPDGTRYRVTVANGGTLSVGAV